MRSLEVLVNGRNVCVAGIHKRGVLSAIVHRVGSEQSEKIHMSIGGLDDSKSVHWPVPSIDVGDEVTIRIVDRLVVDPPQS